LNSIQKLTTALNGCPLLNGQFIGLKKQKWSYPLRWFHWAIKSAYGCEYSFGAFCIGLKKR